MNLDVLLDILFCLHYTDEWKYSLSFGKFNSLLQIAGGYFEVNHFIYAFYIFYKASCSVFWKLSLSFMYRKVMFVEPFDFRQYPSGKWVKLVPILYSFTNIFLIKTLINQSHISAFFFEIIVLYLIGFAARFAEYSVVQHRFYRP